MAEHEEKRDVPDFTLLFAKMREAETSDIADEIQLVTEQVETIRILQQAVPEGDLPYVSTFMSA